MGIPRGRDYCLLALLALFGVWVAAVPAQANTAPSVQINSPINGEVLTPPAEISITASAFDSDGQVTKVEFYANDGFVGEAITSPFIFTMHGVSAGTYILKAKAYDNSGDSTTSDAVTVSVGTAGSNQAPQVELSSPINGATFASPTSISLTASATDSDGQVVKVEFFDNGQLLGSANISPFIFPWMYPPAGTHQLTAKAYDNQGANGTSAPVTITISSGSGTTNQNPQVELSSPPNGSTFTSPADITLTASAWDTDGSVVQVCFYANGNLLGSVDTSPFQYNWTGVAAGTYSVYAMAHDDQGGEGTSATITITVNGSGGTTDGQISEFVARFYTLCLLRDPDTAGLNGWVNNLQSGASTGADVATGFFFSPEFQARGLSNSDWLDVMYQALFNRAADEAGKSGWLDQMQSGASKLSVVDGFTHGQEFINLCNQYGITPFSGYSGGSTAVRDFVSRFYQYCLQRDPDDTGLNAWVSNLQSGVSTGADVGTGFVFSSEFQSRNLSNSDWLDVMYQVFFNRAADEAGKNGWLTQMQSGVSKLAVLDGFTHGGEFVELCNQYSIKPY